MTQQTSVLSAGDFLRVGATRTEFPGSEADARVQFAAVHAVLFDRLLEPAFEATILRLCADAQFEPEPQTPGFREVELSPQRVGRTLNIALSRPSLLRWLEAVTGCGPLARVEGRLAQTLCRPGDQLLWHDDMPDDGQRRLALVLNLSTEPYTGGEFQMRWKGGAPVVEHGHARLGSALLFQVDRALEHRVLPLTSGGPRRVFAGWAFGV